MTTTDTGHPGYVLRTGVDADLVCERCGAVIASPDQHEEHHGQLDRLVTAVEQLTAVVDELAPNHLT